MYPARKSKTQTIHWQPAATLSVLKQRAQILQQIRVYFEREGVLEVETPLLGETSVTDPYIHSVAVALNPGKSPHYLQTSPEYAMKRLLAAGSGSIYQICKAFRAEEIGKIHQIEFTMLEWYRIGFNHHQLMDDMDRFLQFVINTQPAKKMTYAAIFRNVLNIDPHHADVATLLAVLQQQGIQLATPVMERDHLLDLLFTHCLEPHLGQQHQPVFIYDYPASQAALARLQPGTPPCAARFEVYLNGIELANGFHELADANEQRRRFEANTQTRSQLGLPEIPIDEALLAALNAGLPDCAGVALGIDRLIMLATQTDTLDAVLTFPITQG